LYLRLRSVLFVWPLRGCLLLLCLSLENALHDLLLLDQESPDDSLPNAGSATAASVRAGNGLLALRYATVLLRAKADNALQGETAVAAARAFRLLFQGLNNKLAARCLYFPDLI